MTNLHLTATYSFASQDVKTCAQAKEVFNAQPKFSMERYAKTIPFKEQAETERLSESTISIS